MSNPHPHEKVIIAYYRGETIQQYNPKTATWFDWAEYDPRLYQHPPAFSLDISYRVKPYTVGLTLDSCEIEAMWAILQRVGGSPDSTARRYAASVLAKLDACIPEDRKREIYEWEGFSTGIGLDFVKNLP